MGKSYKWMNGEGRKGKERKDGQGGNGGVVVPPSSIILLGRVCLVLVASQRSLVRVTRAIFFYDGCVCARKVRGKPNNFFLCKIFVRGNLGRGGV